MLLPAGRAAAVFIGLNCTYRSISGYRRIPDPDQGSGCPFIPVCQLLQQLFDCAGDIFTFVGFEHLLVPLLLRLLADQRGCLACRLLQLAGIDRLKQIVHRPILQRLPGISELLIGTDEHHLDGAA
ncbi:hypothetical protein D3C80_1479670 [compost metagenome]